MDKYGRKLKVTHDSDNLRLLYHLDDEEGQTVRVLVESLSEEDVQSEEDELDDDGVIVLGRGVSKLISVLQEGAEIDLDESAFADLDAQTELNAKKDNTQRAEDYDQTHCQTCSCEPGLGPCQGFAFVRDILVLYRFECPCFRRCPERTRRYQEERRGSRRTREVVGCTRVPKQFRKEEGGLGGQGRSTTRTVQGEDCRGRTSHRGDAHRDE